MMLSSSSPMYHQEFISVGSDRKHKIVLRFIIYFLTSLVLAKARTGIGIYTINTEFKLSTLKSNLNGRSDFGC